VKRKNQEVHVISPLFGAISVHYICLLMDSLYCWIMIDFTVGELTYLLLLLVTWVDVQNYAFICKKQYNITIT